MSLVSDKECRWGIMGNFFKISISMKFFIHDLFRMCRYCTKKCCSNPTSFKRKIDSCCITWIIKMWEGERNNYMYTIAIWLTKNSFLFLTIVVSWQQHRWCQEVWLIWKSAGWWGCSGCVYPITNEITQRMGY